MASDIGDEEEGRREQVIAERTEAVLGFHRQPTQARPGCAAVAGPDMSGAGAVDGCVLAPVDARTVGSVAKSRFVITVRLCELDWDEASPHRSPHRQTRSSPRVIEVRAVCVA